MLSFDLHERLDARKSDFEASRVPVELTEPRTVLDVEFEWGARTATVAPMPFVDPEKTIPVS